MDKEALRAAQNVLHNILYADMNPEKAGRHVSTERLTEMMIKAYLEWENGDVRIPYAQAAFEAGYKEGFEKGCAETGAACTAVFLESKGKNNEP